MDSYIVSDKSLAQARPGDKGWWSRQTFPDPGAPGNDDPEIQLT